MSTPRYSVDDRTAAAIAAELRALASAEVVPRLREPEPSLAPVPWSEVLFTLDGLRTAEPSGALLHAVAELYPGLLSHLSTLPDRALLDWLERRLGIDRLPVVPDSVVAVPTPDPKKLPVRIGTGTALRGGRDIVGNERRYETTEALTVLGAQVEAVRSYRNAPDPSGEAVGEWQDRSTPFDPFPSGEVPHHADIVTDLIRFRGGDLKVRLTFESASRNLPADLRWWHSTATGVTEVLAATVAGTSATLILTGSCEPLESDPEAGCFIRVALPPAPHPAGAFDISFARLTAQVVERNGLAPDAGFYNDGAVDISKEFQPFGPIPKRGDSFYIKSDEAFAKPLEKLGVTLDVLGDGMMHDVAWGSGYPNYIKVAIMALEDEAKSSVHQYIDDYTADAGEASVSWEWYDGATWSRFHTTEDALRSFPLRDVTIVPPPEYSRPAEIGGVTGRMIRAFLARGDFGWVDYQNRIANFAAEAAKSSGNPQPSDLIPPDPPIVSTIRLSYTTRAVPAVAVRLRNGWASRLHQAGDRLFSLPVPPPPSTGTAGAIGMGIELPGEFVGSVMSLFIDVDPASACTTSDVVPDVTWEYWTDSGGWRSADVIDGTSGLRQAGLVRLVAPIDWVAGCPDFSATSLRWLRIVTNLPDRLGTLRAIVPDAVTAVYRSQLAEPDRDATPEFPLDARGLKGLTVPNAGVKAFTNPLPGRVGRGPEPDPRFARRASERVRHRNRAVQAWDYEAIVSSEFPEVATVRCLPHTSASDDDVPGSVGIVVVPWSDELQPSPSVSLGERILAALRGRLPVHARPVVLCPLYQGVSVEANAVLRPGYGAAEAKRSLAAAIDAYLRPGADAPFGRELFASTLVRFLESRPEVDHVTTFRLVADPCPGNAGGAPCRLERVSVDPCRGLVASTGNHVLTLTEQL